MATRRLVANSEMGLTPIPLPSRTSAPISSVRNRRTLSASGLPASHSTPE